MKKPNRRVEDYLLFSEAWLLLAVARFMLICFSFKKIMPILGKQTIYKEEVEQAGHQTLLLAIKLAIVRASGYSPWRTKCFEQALAAKMMLKRRNLISTVFFGVYKDENNILHAHAWLQSCRLIVTGGTGLDRYTILSAFKS